MATQTDIPSDLTNDEKAAIFQFLDIWLNDIILLVLLHGIYTGILAVTLWNIFINKCWTIRRATVIVVLLLHALTTISIAAYWSYTYLAFITNGQNFWTINLVGKVNGNTATWVIDITASISTILAESYMIWCCWMVWGRRWLVVLLPIFFLVIAIVSRTTGEYYDFVGTHPQVPNMLFMLYLSVVLATTLSCTLFIIYRIVAAAGTRNGAVGRLGVFHRFIAVLVESSALYSIFLILDLVFTIRNDPKMIYVDTIGSIVKGVAPTLIVGRAAAGHTRPREDTDGCTVSSLHFQMRPEPASTTGSQYEESAIQSSVIAMDIEAQPELQVVEQDAVVSTMGKVVVLE
ncbi:hypothetical protein EDD18DRAFT_1462880 [Armillaria luteobubalina]|uniref:Uncharacterized protein n=1 Tax=Armillaria luteobubalina TaxID=153913 RepID=A0AA39Q541_9AGAR|nr:hypothetical protein EDD18DRAFT_1462880 [Armillaria luteobubalina]